MLNEARRERNCSYSNAFESRRASIEWNLLYISNCDVIILAICVSYIHAICVWYTKLYPICVQYVPYAYGTKYTCGTEHL